MARVGQPATADSDAFRQLDECQEALRALALQASHAVDRERNRIARGLHDDMGQLLVAVQLRIAELERVRTDGERHEVIATLRDLIAQAIESSRSLTFELMAALMPELGIDEELESAAARFSARYDIRCRLETDSAPKRLGRDEAAALLRATTELLVNAGKHSGAEKVVIESTRQDDTVQITVRDNGVGFKPGGSAPSPQGGFGLLIVQERLREIGGDVVIESDAGAGTRVTMTAPVLEGRR